MQNKMNYQTVVQLALQYLVYEKKQIWYIMAYTAAIGAIGFASTVTIQFIVNELSFTGQSYPLVLLSSLVLSLLIFNIVLQIVRKIVIELIQQRILVRITFGAVDALGFTKWDRRNESRTDIVHRYFDGFAYQKAMTNLLLDGIGVIVFSVLGTFLIAFYHPFLFVLSLVVLIAFVYIILHFFHEALQTNYDQSSYKYKISAWLSQVAENRSLFWNSHTHQFVLDQTDHELQDYLKARQKHFRVSVWQEGTLYLLQAVGAGLFLALGGGLVLAGHIHIGQLVAAETVVVALLYNMANYGKTLDQAYDMIVATQKLNALTQWDNLDTIDKKESTCLDWSSHTQLILNSPLFEKNLILKPGHILSLQSGSMEERRHLLYYLAGIETHTAHEILIDQVAYSNLSDSWKKEHVVLLDRTPVFDTSADANLKMSVKPHFTEQELNLIKQLPYVKNQTFLLEESVDTSIHLSDPNSRIHLALARSFFLPAHVILIDGLMDQLTLAEQKIYLDHMQSYATEKIIIILGASNLSQHSHVQELKWI